MGERTEADAVREAVGSEEFDWYPLLEQVQHVLRLAIARHPKAGKALSYEEGEQLTQDTASKIISAVRAALAAKEEA